jgi:hypothetical protein
MKSSPAKELLLNLALFAAILAVTLAGVEVFFRTTHLFGARISWSIPDPVLGYSVAPGKYWYGLENDHPVIWSANRHGWRDREWEETKPEGSLRVAVLGDSYVEAMQVEDEKTFLNLAENQLTQSLGKPVEMMNFGRSAFTQTEQLLVLQREVLSFSPDLVVLFFFPVNDIDDVHPKTVLGRLRPFYSEREDGSLELDTRFNQTREYRLKSLINPLKRHSAFISLLTDTYTRRSRMEDARRSGLMEEAPSQRLKGHLSLAGSAPDPQYVSNYKLNKRLIREMADFCREHKIPFMLVSIDLPAYVPQMEKEFKELDPAFDRLFFDKDLESFSRELNIPFLGLEKIFEAHYRQHQKALHFEPAAGQEKNAGFWEYGSHGGHWNEAGHQVVAEALSRALPQALKGSSEDNLQNPDSLAVN